MSTILNNEMGDFFSDNLDVNGALYQLSLFNIFLENIMEETIHDNHAFVFISWRLHCQSICPALPPDDQFWRTSMAVLQLVPVKK